MPKEIKNKYSRQKKELSNNPIRFRGINSNNACQSKCECIDEIKILDFLLYAALKNIINEKQPFD